MNFHPREDRSKHCLDEKQRQWISSSLDLAHVSRKNAMVWLVVSRIPREQKGCIYGE